MRSWPLSVTAALALACGTENSTGPVRAGGEPPRPVAADVSSAATTNYVVVDQNGNVGTFTSLVSSSGGRQHITYYDDTNGKLKYATCAGACGTASNWSKGVIDGAGDVGEHGSLKVASGGRRDVIYADFTHFDLKYATCAASSNCTAASDWVKTRVDSAGVVGFGSSLALGSDGRRQASYLKSVVGGRALKYASCLSSCGQPSGWSKVTIELINASTSFGGEVTSLALGSDGRRHLIYFDPANKNLKYATCLSSCTSAFNWQKLPIDQTGVVGLYASLAVGLGGVLHVSYYDFTNGDLKYARCAFDCTTAANWKKVTVRSVGDTGGFTSLALGGNGRVHVSFYSFTGSALFYETCEANCTVASSWTAALLDGAFSLAAGWYSSLALAGNQVHVSYYDQTNGNLKYLERTP